MILDLIVIVIFGLTIFLTMRSGFIISVTKFAKGIFAVIAAWLLCDDLAVFLLKGTAVGARILEKFSDAAGAHLENSSLYRLLPDLFKGGTKLGDLIDAGTEKLALIALTVVSFFLIIIVIRLVLIPFLKRFSKKKSRGFAGFLDWILGLALGIVLGAIYVMLFLALLFPIAGILFPDLTGSIIDQLGTSIFAADLYNNNLLLILIRDLIA